MSFLRLLGLWLALGGTAALAFEPMGTSSNVFEPGSVVLVAKPIFGGFADHGFLVVTDMKGQATAVRFGPSLGENGTVPYVSSPNATEATTGSGTNFGNVVGDVRPWNADHQDWNRTDALRVIRYQATGLQWGQTQEVLGTSIRVVDTANAFGAKYNLRTNNCNTGAFILTDVLGYDTRPLGGIAPGWGNVLHQDAGAGGFIVTGATYDGRTITPAPATPQPIVPALPAPVTVPVLKSEAPAPSVVQAVSLDRVAYVRDAAGNVREYHNLTPEQEFAFLRLGATIATTNVAAHDIVSLSTPIVTFIPAPLPLQAPALGPVPVGVVTVGPITEVPSLTETFTPVFSPQYAEFGNLSLKGDFGFGPMVTNPEPSTWLLMLTGLFIILLWRHRAAAVPA